MAKFLNNAGFIIETDDADKIQCYKSKGLKEFIEEPKPVQDVEIVDEFTVKPARTKPANKKTKK